MFSEHPAWCSRGEQAGEDHQSIGRVASSQHDIVGVVVRLVSLGSPVSITVVEIEYMDDGVPAARRLPVPQAHQLATTILELTSSA